MIGVLVIIGLIVYKIIYDINRVNTAKDRKKRAIENGIGCYTDSNGYTVHTDTGQPFMYSHFATGKYTKDVYEINPATGKIVRNVSEDCRRELDNKRRQEAIAKGEEYYRFEESWNRHNSDVIQGYRYKNVNTGKIYVKRDYLDLEWWMDVNTRRIVGLTKYGEERARDFTYLKPNGYGVWTGDDVRGYNEDIINEDMRHINNWLSNEEAKGKEVCSLGCSNEI